MGRLGNAFWSVLLGLFVVIPFSVSFLWVNERRAAQLDTLIRVGATEAETIEALEKDCLGGGETTTKTYSYKKQWCSSLQDSTKFHEKKGHKNTSSPSSSMAPVTRPTICSRIWWSS